MNDRAGACRAASPTRCTAHTRLYRGGVLVEQGFDVARISDHLADGDSVVWLDLMQPDDADMDVVVEELGLHPLAIEDALREHQRPKLDHYSDHEFLAAYGLRLESGQVRSGEVAVFVTPRALVTVRKDAEVDLDGFLRRWDNAPELADTGVAFLLHGLLDVLVDGYTDVAQELTDEGEGLEGTLFQQGAERDLQRRTFAMRSSVAALRRVVLPMQEVLGQLHRHDSPIADARTAPYFRDVEDHLLRVQATLDELRELLSSVLDTTLAVQGQRLNETLFKLTAYAAILAVTTAVTGFFGQNIPYPGIDQRSGFIASTVLLVSSVTALFVYFKRKGWL